MENAEWPDGNDCLMSLYSSSLWLLPVQVYSLI